MTVVLPINLPRQQLPQPTDRLSDGFLHALPAPVGLWLPSKLAQAAADFTPLPQKHFGALNGGITTVPGGFGTLGAAWLFSGGTIVAPFTLGSPQNFSVVLRISTIASFVNGTRYGIVGHQVDASNNWGVFLVAANSTTANIDFCYRRAGTKFNAESSLAVVATNSTYLIVCTYNGSSSAVYVNGEAVASSATSSAGSAANNTIIFGTSNGFSWTGNLSLAAVYSATLAPAQVSTLYDCLLTGEPFPLFAPEVRGMIAVPATGAFSAPLTGALTFSGVMRFSISKSLSAGLGFTGTQIRQIVKQHLAALSFNGKIQQGTNKSQTATLSFTGSQSRGISKAISATLGFAGNVNQALNKSLSGTLSFTGAIARNIGKTLTAGLSFIGSIGRSIVHKLSAGLSFAASLSNGHAQQVTLTAVLSFSGNVNRGISKSLSAVLSFSGALRQGISKGLTATLGFVGSVGRSITKRLTAVLGFGGSLANGAAKMLMKLRRWFLDE